MAVVSEFWVWNRALAVVMSLRTDWIAPIEYRSMGLSHGRRFSRNMPLEFLYIANGGFHQ